MAVTLDHADTLLPYILDTANMSAYYMAVILNHADTKGPYISDLGNMYMFHWLNFG